MYDDAGFIILSCVGAIAVLSSLSALIWAAVWDGRDERAFRAMRKGASSQRRAFSAISKRR
jgi:uncharacterized membrane protein